ncbi:MAG TPA: hypothetical protein PKB14_21485 [Rubrivivax sp.]|nr:hypothetical protein [Rubrivivax sp.]
MKRQQHIASGISLIEAVVALAVIAFGMLAYVGLQSSMRFNSDVAKQRAEAVRIAQQAIEEGRAYSVVETKTGQTAYADLADGSTSTVVTGDNGSFTLQRTVTDAATTTDPLLIGAAPRMKTLTVDVSWQDRNGETQNVRLSTTITASPPELAGTLALPRSGGGAHGRHAAIPVRADTLSDNGRFSVYRPSGVTGAPVFVFNNMTGMIVGMCNGATLAQTSTWAAIQSLNCDNNANALPLSGFVRFSTGMVQPQAADAENPIDTALPLQVVLLDLTSRGQAAPTYSCYARTISLPTSRTVVPYFCAVFFPTGQAGLTPRWSGRSELVLPSAAAAWQWAVDKDDDDAGHLRVCRYTPATSDAQVIPNQQHPRDYVDAEASEALTDQNFLVIRAGNDDGVNPTPQAFTCPTDVAANPAAGDFVNSNTLVHQPAP